MEVSLTKTVKPTVINDELLMKCAVRDYCKGPEVSKITKTETFDFGEVDSLSLEFENLSFNNIEKISGLENLKSLTDLSLTSNRIKKVENLDALQQLQILSLKDNQVHGIENIQYLLHFSNLHSVSFSGNPVTYLEDFNLKVLIFIPSVRYLDYRLITEEEKREANLKYTKIVEEVNEILKEKEKIEREIAKQNETRTLYQEAYIEDFMDSQFLNNLMSSHSKSQHLLASSGFTETLAQFSDDFNEICKQWEKEGLQTKELFNNEFNSLCSCIKQHVSANMQRCESYCFTFGEYKDRILMANDLCDINDFQSDFEREIFDNLRNQQQSLWHMLMSEEMQLAEHITKMIDLFHDEVSELVDQYNAKILEFIQQLQNLNSELMTNACIYYADCFTCKNAKDTIDSEGPEDYISSFDHLMYDGNDVRAAAIKQRGELVISQFSNLVAETCHRLTMIELERHRQKLIESNMYCVLVKDEIHAKTYNPFY